MKQVNLVISGEVQGVGFRAWVLRYAQGEPLTGWVKNRKDGTVEIVAEGSKIDLEELIKHCRHGPPAAEIEKIDVTWGIATGKYLSFEAVL